MPRPEHFGARSAAPRGSREAFAACPTDMKVGGILYVDHVLSVHSLPFDPCTAEAGAEWRAGHHGELQVGQRRCSRCDSFGLGVITTA